MIFSKFTICSRDEQIKKAQISAVKAALEDEGFCVICASCGSFEPILKNDNEKVIIIYEGTEAEIYYNCDGVFYLAHGDSVKSNSFNEFEERDINYWIGHPHFRIIGYDDLPCKLLDEVFALLGIPEPLETERKFIIKRPCDSDLYNYPFCRSADITQIYLKSADGSEERIRKRTDTYGCAYFHTIKRKLEGAKREEIERRITKEEFEILSANADPIKKPLSKTRYCLLHSGQYFEIDIYPFFTDKAILEIELLDEDDSINIPEYITIIKEVTDDPQYKNSALAAL